MVDVSEMVEVVATVQVFDVCGGLILVSGYLRFHIWGFLLCGATSLVLSDAARLGVADLFGSSNKRYDPGTRQSRT